MKDWPNPLFSLPDVRFDYGEQIKAAMLNFTMPPGHTTLDRLTETANAVLNSQRAQIIDTSELATKAVAQMVEQMQAPAIALQESIQRMLGELPPLNQVQQTIKILPSAAFFQSLPTLTSVTETYDQVLATLVQAQAEEQAGVQVLDDADFKFVANYLAARLFRDFASVDQRVRSAVITNSLKGFVNSSEFLESVEQAATNSAVVKRRWHILEKGLHHQRRRDYVVSIPVLMPQFEGLLADTLILRSLVERDGTKLYELDPATGARRPNKKGGPIEVNGLNALITKSNYAGSPELGFLADHVSNRLCGQRNGVLHGANTTYGNAKLSVSLSVLIATMIDAITELESVAQN